VQQRDGLLPSSTHAGCLEKCYLYKPSYPETLGVMGRAQQRQCQTPVARDNNRKQYTQQPVARTLTIIRSAAALRADSGTSLLASADQFDQQIHCRSVSHFCTKLAHFDRGKKPPKIPKLPCSLGSSLHCRQSK
jgi:hypothetical protein